MEASDTDLMLRLKAGDDLALNVLMDRWVARVTSFLQRMTGNRNIAADLAQETFVKIYQSRDRYKSGGTFSTYLFSIAANLARNHHRWQSRHPNVSLDDFGADLTDSSPSPRQALESQEKLAVVRATIAALPPDLREAITLFIDEEMSYAQIAQIANCSSKAAETRIYRARQLLKAALAPSYEAHREKN
jgi:RNA polymerase sigma-70 factor, ECF subfamily